MYIPVSKKTVYFSNCEGFSDCTDDTNREQG